MAQNKRQTHGPNRAPAEKPKNFKSAITSIAKYCKSYWGYIIVALIVATLSSILAVIGPNKLQDLVNKITGGLMGSMDFAGIWNLAYVLIAIYATSAICMAIQSILMAKVSHNVSKNLRTDIDKKINKLPIKYIDSKSHGDLLSRVTNDVDTISQGLNSSVATIVHSVVLVLATIIMMFVTNWILALVTIGTSLIGFFLIAVIMSKSQKHFVAQQKHLGELDGHIEEIYKGYSIIKVYNATNEETKKFEDINNKLYNSTWKSQFLSGLMMPLMDFVGNFSYVAVCIVGAVLASNGKTDIGTIMAFIIYARLFTNPLTQIAQALTYLQSSAAASERVFEFLNQPEMQDEANKKIVLNVQDIKGNVSFKNVTFGYNPEKTIIDNFSIDIKAGQKVAIVGPTGAGKTTIVNLLMKFYEIDNGQILIDGIDTKDISRDNIHNLFGMVLQDTWLFDGTIKENLKFNNQNITDKQINKILEECGLTHFVKTLPNGIDTILDDNTAVSAGQKQLLTIARAMLQNSPMIILDEATSNVDTRTETIIQSAMDKLTQNRTSFVIAHRLSTIKNADVIIVMQDGKIVETGNHKTLISQNGAYAKLYNSQFEN